MNLLKLILKNKNIIIGNNKLFSRNTYKILRAITKGKIPNDTNLTKEQTQLIIDAFLISNNTFTKDTPTFILCNNDCIKHSITRDINSIKYIDFIPTTLENYIINEALNQNYTLKENSPSVLKNSFDVALHSIKIECLSANFIDWFSKPEEEINKLIDETIQCGYILSNNSNEFLTKNKHIVLSSIKKNINNIKYAHKSIREDADIFKYLLLNGYQDENTHITEKKLNYFTDFKVMTYSFKKEGIYNHTNETYIERFTKIYCDAINSKPLIKTFDSLFQIVAEETWKKHKINNADDYENIFGKICAELRNGSNFNKAINNLSFLNNLQETLEQKYPLLHQAMFEYFNIYHSDIPHKSSKLESSKNIIANLSATYVSKSKENYKKKKISEYYAYIEDYFIPDTTNSYVNKKISESKQKEKFKKLYEIKDKDVKDFINQLVKTYNKDLDSTIIHKMIKDFVVYNHSKLHQIIPVPSHYRAYERYEKVTKLINRLNSNYIQYDGPEVLNYRDVISYDNTKNKYIYTGLKFNDRDVRKYNDYVRKEEIFNKIKKDIMKKVKTIELVDSIDLNDNILDELLEDLATELPFNDEYFKFNNKYTLEKFNLSELIKSSVNTDYDFELNTLVSDESFEKIYNLLVNNNLIWLLMFINGFRIEEDFNMGGISKYHLMGIINNMENIISLAQEFNFDINNIEELLILYKISKCADNESIAILGYEIIEKLHNNQEYTSEPQKKIISKAKELVCQMTKRNESTIPYIRGKYINYKYSLYDSQDETILLSGINTASCFKISGNDNDFLHYCALDKNGFVIKITDIYDNFIGKASGFRHGNCVFINQLRTIYDEDGNCYNGEYNHEKNDIIATLKKACEAIVATSQKNPEEVTKIDYVFITQSYSMKDYESNVPDSVEQKIGRHPMDTNSKDWYYFVGNTNNLSEAEDDNPFTTDYGNYSLICLASYKKISPKKTKNIKLKDVPAVYKRPRNKIIAKFTPDTYISKKVNKIRGIKCFFDKTNFKSVSLPENSLVLLGDNWYIVYKNSSIIDSCLLDFDEQAKIEYEATIQILKEEKYNNDEQINIEKLSTNISVQTTEFYKKVLKKDTY